MGGYGSTRWQLHTRRTCVEETSRISMAALTRQVKLPIPDNPTKLPEALFVWGNTRLGLHR